MLDNQAAPADTSAPAAAPAVMSDADVSRLAGEAFDRVMGGDNATETQSAAATTEAEPAKADASAPAPRDDGRDEKGRFAPKPGDEPKQAAAEPEKDAAAKPEGEPDAAKAADAIPLAPPTSWRALGEEWDTLPRSAQEKVIAREREINAGFSDLGRKVKAYEPIGQVLGHHKDFLAQTNMEAPQLIHGLINQYQAMNANPQQTLAALAREYQIDPLSLIGDNPAAAIQRIAQQHRIDLLDLVANGVPETAPSRPDPMIAQLEQRLAAQDAELRRLSGSMTARERAERDAIDRAATAREAQIMDTISPVIDATPDWESLQDRVAVLLPIVQAESPNASPADVLKAAIDQARWADPRVRSRLTADTAAQTTQQKLTSMTERAAKAKAATASNVKGATTSQPAPLTEQAEIDAVTKKYGLV